MERFFFFQAEDGIRDRTVTGVQTCALPILNEGDPQYVTFKCFDQKRLLSFQKGLVVEVAGAHVQEVNQPTVTKVTGSPLDISQIPTGGKQTITLDGTLLDSVTGVNLKLGTVSLSLKPTAAAAGV